MNWTFHQTRVSSFWIARPCVPGGAARILCMDDFGNAVPATAKLSVQEG